MKLALFDLDGTLIDSEAGILGSIEFALNTLGAAVPAREELRSWIGPPLRATFPSVFGEGASNVERAVALYRERFSTQGWREHTLYVGIGDVIEALHARGVKLAVVTSKSSEYASRIVDSLPFGARFARVYAAPPDSTHSEKAQMIAQALTDFATPADAAAMVGDRRFDIEGARATGVRAVGVTWGFGSREELVSAGADDIAVDAADLLRILIAAAAPADAGARGDGGD